MHRRRPLRGPLPRKGHAGAATAATPGLGFRVLQFGTIDDLASFAVAAALDPCRSRGAAQPGFGPGDGVDRPGQVPAAQGRAQRGNAAATPPSTGSVAPVVGVAFDAKNTTARPTWAPVIRACRRLRSR